MQATVLIRFKVGILSLAMLLAGSGIAFGADESAAPEAVSDTANANSSTDAIVVGGDKQADTKAKKKKREWGSPKKKEDDGGYYGTIKYHAPAQDVPRPPAVEKPKAVVTPPVHVTATATPTPAEAPVVAKPQRLMLFKATKGEKTLYMLGTIHVSRPLFYPLPEQIEEIFDQCPTMFVEAKITEKDSERVAKWMSDKEHYPKGDSLSKHLSPETKKAFQEYLTWAGEPMSLYEDVKPWALTAQLDTRAIQQAGFDSNLGIDLHFVRKARQNNKKILALETPEGQLQALVDLPDSFQDKVLRASILKLKDMKVHVHKAEQAWRSGDLDEMVKAVAEGNGNQQDIQEADAKWLGDRNVIMVSNLNKQVATNSGPFFVCVGSAHYVGPNNLIDLLKKDGYEVTQMDRAAKQETASKFGGKFLKQMYFPEGQFSVMLPGNPKTEYSTLNSMRVVAYEYKDLHGSYLAAYILFGENIPLSYLPQSKLQELLDKIRLDGMVKPLKEIRRTPCSVQGYPGRSVDLGCKEGNMFGRMKEFIVGQRIHIIGVISDEKAWLNSASANSFLASFKARSERGGSYAYGAQPARSSRSYSGSHSGGESVSDYNERLQAERRARDDLQRLESSVNHSRWRSEQRSREAQIEHDARMSRYGR